MLKRTLAYHAGRHVSTSPRSVTSARSPFHHGARGSRESSAASNSSVQPQEQTKRKRAKKADFSLSVAHEEIMLEFLTENPIIWDRKRSDYRRVHKKGKLWHDQGILMEKPDFHLQGWFKSLRDTNTRLHKNKSGDGASELTEREQWIKDKFVFLKSVVRHRPEPYKSIKAASDEHPGDLDAAEAACADLQLLSPDAMPSASTSTSTSTSVPHKGMGKRAKAQDDDEALLSSLQQCVDESGAALKDLQARREHQQPVTQRSVFANYVRDSLVTMSKRKFKKVRSAMNHILSEVMEEDSDADETISYFKIEN
ncbi:uncharacterized protein LOC115021781 [Cottoperca gobio]|uniref:Uncharacterized protein LOC115021781 n=1 Tax=Cottoperca gobio TaxID=56716 RepID=A0A6J2RDP5_COTGO|nr:uncharacterized protein LOC115021781 [Cottoperca gobio]